MAAFAFGALRRAKPARHVVGVSAASHEDRARPGLQVQDRHRCGIEAARDRPDREQHGPAARQHFGPQVIGLPLCGVGACEDRHRSARRTNALQARGSDTGRENDRFIRSPGGAARIAVERRQRDRRPAGHRHFLQCAVVVHEPDPVAVGGDKRSARSPFEHGRRLQGIERPDKKLRAVIADIDHA